MPTIPSRARRWIQSGRATPFWDHGLFCVRLNAEPSGREKQEIVGAIDPGSKKEGITVKSKAHTFLNVQADAVTWVKKHIKTKGIMRTGRRGRKMPCRQPRQNRARSAGWLPPSTKARWQAKVRLTRWIKRRFPVMTAVVEDVKAKTRKGKRRWNSSFSPLEVGKKWFYQQLEDMGLKVILRSGWETKQLRDALGLRKTSKKTAEVFEAHCVDSWVLANDYIGGHTAPENKRLLCVTPIELHRRQLHRLEPKKKGERKPYGGTLSEGFKRGALVRHKKYGACYVGGCDRDRHRISLHRLSDGERLCQNAHPHDIKFLAYNSWRARLLPIP